MLEDLDKLISFVKKEYKVLNLKWEKSNYYTEINLKNNKVLNLLNNEKILHTIFNYREFINEHNIQLVNDFKQFNNEKVKINTRTKTKNSIEFKMKNYIQNHEDGKVSINKCFNDIFGIRIICLEELTYEQISKFMNYKYRDLKCINSSKQEYKATHIYFKQDNYKFQWELQIWNKKDEINNINSHEKYKQEYIKWEKENRGGNNQW